MRTAPEAKRGERKQVTAVFIDLVGFSKVASTADAEDLQEWLENYYRQSKAVVDAAGGEITEYLGDGIVALFGLEKADELAATKAVRAALRAVGKINTSFGGFSAVRLRAGVATGEVVTRETDGRDGLPRATGVVTTLAQRIQETAAPSTVMISESTRNLLRGPISVTARPDQRLKGFSDPQTLFLAEEALARRAVGEQDVFVGRQSELDEIAKASKPCLVVGQAGVGKSALVSAFARDAERVEVFQADGADSVSSYQPFRDWIFGRIGQTAPSYYDICTAFPELDSQQHQSLALIMGLPEGQRLLSELSNLVLKEQIERSLWQAIQSTAPSGLLIFEDMHWFDAASFGTLQTILRDPTHKLFKILLTSREDAKLEQYLVDLPLHNIMLSELDQAESAKLLAVFQSDLSPSLRGRIIEQSGGIPLFLEQLLKRSQSADNAAIPETLMDLLAERIDSTGAAKPVLQRASALGRTFSSDVLRALDPDGADPLADLKHGVACGVLQPLPDERWTFSHALLKQAAYQSLLRGTSERLHARIADVLQTQFPDQIARDPAVLAEHQSRAKLYPEAIQSYLTASHSSLVQGALPDAEKHARMAIALCDDAPADLDLSTLEIASHTALGSVLMQVQGFTAPPVREAFDAVLRIAKARPALTEDSAAALFGSFSHAIMAADRKGAVEFNDLLAEIAHNAPPDPEGSEIRLASLVAKNCACFYEGDFHSQFRHMEMIRSMYDLEQHGAMIGRYGMDVFAAAQLFEVPARIIGGQAERVDELLAETDAHQQRLNVPVMHPYTLIWGSVSLYYAGKLEAALERLDRGLAAADKHRTAFWQLLGQVWLHQMDERLTGSQQGVEHFGSLIEAQTAVGSRIGGTYFRSQYAKRLAPFGLENRAYAMSGDAVKEADSSGLQCWFAEILRAHARVCRTLGRDEEARLSLLRALDVAKRQGARLWQLRAALDLADMDGGGTQALSEAMAQVSPQSPLPEVRRAASLLVAP